MSRRLPWLTYIASWSWTARLISALIALVGITTLQTLVAVVEYRLARGAWLFAADSADPLYELGTSYGFWGMVFFCLNFVLATRWRWVEALSGGLDKVYQLHGLVGKWTLSLLVAHYALLLFQALPDTRTVLAYSIPGLDVSYTLGGLGLFVLTGLVVVTIWYRLPYQTWLKTHTSMGVAYILGGAHALVAQGDWYIALLTLVGGYAWLYSLVFYRKHAAHARGEVLQTRHIHRITELVLRLENTFTVAPGQFVFFGVTQSRAGLPDELHPFSVSQIIDATTIRISAKAIGDYTGALPQLHAGDRVVVYGPHGYFGAHATTGGAVLWVAGGIGITPFLNMLHSEAARPQAQAVSLVWAVREPVEAIYADEITQLTAQAPHITVHIHVGVLTAAVIAQLTGQSPTAYATLAVCGPPPMMAALRSQWRAAGVARERIVSEEFGMR